MFVWYSNATDITGKALAEALNCEGGTALPADIQGEVLCWGTKTKAGIDTPKGVTFFNHPNNIRKNRNKFLALGLFKEAGCNTGRFTDNLNEAVNFTFPVVARTKFHQGGTGFWLCLNERQLKAAADEGAQYFQEYIHIKDEYRAHIVDGKVIRTVKKAPRNNMKAAFKEHHKKVITNYAKKRLIEYDEATLDFVLTRMARKFAVHPDRIIRSNTRGWKFVPAVATEELSQEAIKAVNALGLEFGAVDCATTEDGKVYIIEVNSGPGLDGATFNIWVEALKALIAKQDMPAAEKDKKAVKAEGLAELAADAKLQQIADNLKDLLNALKAHDPEKAKQVVADF